MDTDDELNHLSKMCADLDQLSNVCADLVSLKRLEPALLHLFQRRGAGTWVPVRELYESGGAGGGIPTSLSAAWLPSPAGDSGYAVISFYDDDLKWSQSAVYNVARLLQSHSVVPSAAVA